jgi:peptidoglycan/LPS O-acetylase OafA/YrhL
MNHSPEQSMEQSSAYSRAIQKFLGEYRSFETVMKENKGIGPGFDALRIVLALVILAYHSLLLAPNGAGYAFVNQHLYLFVIALVPMFFGLSGFLVTGSALRTQSVKVFLTYRGLRIFPALVVEVTLCALLLGPFMTSLPLAEYFTTKQFFTYFGNIVGIVRMELPGVFLDNPYPKVVNGSLWTLQPEFYCYLIMAALMLSSLVYRRKWYTWAFVASTALLTALNALYGFGNPGDLFPPNVIIYYFFVGIAAYHWRAYIPAHPVLFVIALLLSPLMLSQQGLIYLAAIPVTYCTLYIGMLKLPRIPLLQNGDYSYGIYLLHFPILQSLAYLVPALREWWMLMLFAVPLTIGLAALSWHWIEKPFLQLKKRILPSKAAPISMPVAPVSST